MERLNSWKEIANHLGVTVRTAQNWEHERGLPVERLPGTRGPVSITIASLEKWRQGAPPAQVEETTAPAKRAYKWRAAALLSGLAVVSVLTTLWMHASTHRTPVSYRLAGNTLVMLDAANQPIWEHSFDRPLHEAAYKEGELAWLGDLDGDGKPEFLFSYQPGYDVSGSVLYCFSGDGKVLWTFVPGHRVSTTGESFDPSFFAVRALAVSKDRERGTVILVSSAHALYYPDQVALLSTQGKLLAEYWHSGHLPVMRVFDLDKDGKNEIYLGGIDNDLHAATLIVLPVDGLLGTSASRQSPDYQLTGMPLAREKVRLIFPRSCINKESDTFNKLTAIVLGSTTLTISTQEDFVPNRAHSSIMYEFDRGLHLKKATPTFVFRVLHEELESKGEIKHKLTEAELQAFKNIRDLAVENR